jgi:glycosyltransferase involved in cell wall biosynthesis
MGAGEGTGEPVGAGTRGAAGAAGVRVSVAMTACDSQRYLAEQVYSVLPQLGGADELVLSVDPSSDGTLELARGLAAGDARVRVVEGPGLGVVANVQHALELAQGAYIFLADSDDVWLQDKVAHVLAEFERSGAALVLHDAAVVDAELKVQALSFFAQRHVGEGFWRNLWRNGFIGCCMAFTAALKRVVLPIPPEVPMHDQWIGLLAEQNGGVALLPEPLLLYRRHGDNLTKSEHASIPQMLAWRTTLTRALAQRMHDLTV